MHEIVLNKRNAINTVNKLLFLEASNTLRQNERMNSLTQIIEPIKNELDQYQNFFEESLHDHYKQVRRINKYILKQQGKQMRPIMVLLSAKLIGDVNDTTIRTAAFLEMLHNATLIHDDVVDDTDERRGILSIRAFWDNKTAVLIGDYLLSTSLQLAIATKNFDLVDLMSVVGKALSKGEIMQMNKSKDFDFSEDTYFEVIDNKTAVLFECCAKAGSITAGADAEQAELVAKVGSYMGLAFQIKDDIIDYLHFKIGKPTGNDIKENKITLPLIYAVNNCTEKEKNSIMKLFKKSKKRHQDIKTIINFVNEKGGVTHATEKMQEYVEKAKDILNQFEDNEARKSLLDLIEFTILRKK